MAKISSYFPSKWLRGSDAEEGDLLLVIRRISIETIGQGADAEKKPVAWFESEPRGLILNKTNANSLKAMFGDETDDWVGRTIRIYQTETSYNGEMVSTLRIKGANRGPSRPSLSQASDVRYPRGLADRIQNIPRVEQAPDETEGESESSPF
jgi:hypothetical protein